MWRLVLLAGSYAVVGLAALIAALWLRWELIERRRRRPHLRIIRKTNPPRSHVRVLP